MERMANIMNSICQSDMKHSQYDSSCTPHPGGPDNEPACTPGGHCVDNVSISRRPTRQDMLEWLK